MTFETEHLFPFFLGKSSKLDMTDFDSYNHGIKWTTGYPRKLDAEDWLYNTSMKLQEYSEGQAYLEEMLNPSIKLNITGYPNGAIYSFMVVIGPNKTEWYYNPSSNQKFHRV